MTFLPTGHCYLCAVWIGLLSTMSYNWLCSLRNADQFSCRRNEEGLFGSMKKRTAMMTQFGIRDVEAGPPLLHTWVR